MARPLISHLATGQAPQFVMNDRHELLEGGAIATAPGLQEHGDRVIGIGRLQVIRQADRPES
jgi:hypothetical protein